MESAPPPDTSATASETGMTPVAPPAPTPVSSDADGSVPRGTSSDIGGGAGTWHSQSEAITAVNGQLEDIFFPYDQSDLSPEATAALGRDAKLFHEILGEFPQLQVSVEGHCDERGSAEYNLGLGDRRASRTIASLAQLGLPAANFSPVSYGKEAPQCTESNESCWSHNRRAHFVVRSRPTE